MKKLNLFSSLFLLSFTLSPAVFAKTLSFELKPLPTERSNAVEIKQGLKDLFGDQASEKLISEEVQNSDEFQNLVYETLSQQIQNKKMISVEVNEKFILGNIVKETTIHFPSLIQRPHDHASNQVVARIYEPTVSKPFCDYKYPTSIFLHHILNEVGIIEDLSKGMASGILHQPGIIVVIHMPHYGDRRQGNEEFLTSDLKEFRKNMAQLILDVHMLRNYIETRENVDTQKISLSGISLGAVMGLTVGAFDQGFASYANLVGGTDMAQILFNRATKNPDSEVAIALKNINLNEDSVREELAPVDSMTWLHRYKNKKIFILSASRDAIINYDHSVKPMLNRLGEAQNKVTHRLNDDEHSPTGSVLKKFSKVFSPLLDAVVDGSPSYNFVCPDKFIN
jgi:predicted peptidase